MNADGRGIRFAARINFESRELQIVIMKRKMGDPGTMILKPISLQDEASWTMKPEGELTERASLSIPMEDVDRFLADMKRDVNAMNQ